MFKKLSISAITAITMAVTPVNNAAAGSGDALLGGIVGGIVGGVIVNSVNKNKANNNKPKTVRRSTYNSAQRQENRDVQTSLNYYSFPAGVADGVFGNRTRNAISSYQIFMTYPATGSLTEFQKTVLINSYHRSIAGGVVASQLVSTSPYGTRGMLQHVQQEMVGGAGGNAQQQTLANTTLTSSAFAVPSFGEASDVGSLVNHCNKINLVTSTNGGYTKISDMKDPAFALNEQFCLARVYAISTSEEMISHVQGGNSAQIHEQCETLGPTFKEQISAISLGSREQVVTNATNAILSIGMSPAQLIRTGKICLGVGYRIDNLDVALASTLILVTLGEPVYGELLGHHLLNGFGTARRTDLAMQWYASASDAIDQGQPAVFVPGLTERPKLIQTAVARIGDPTTEPTEQSQWFGITVPTFWSETSSDAAE